MGKYLELKSIDEHRFRAYVAEPATAPKAALVLLQEMDQRHYGWEASRVPTVTGSPHLPGVSAPIRSVAESYAALGFLVIAPSTFSRGRSGIDYGYRFEDPHQKLHPRIIKPLQALGSPLVLLDVQAALDYGHLRLPGAHVGLLGFCWGGLLAWRAACTLEGVSAAVCYYGGGMTVLPDQTRHPLCPVLAHFGNDDQFMKVASVKAFASAQAHPSTGLPPVQLEIYEAAYGFNRPGRRAFSEQAAMLARARTLAFMATHLQD